MLESSVLLATSGAIGVDSVFSPTGLAELSVGETGDKELPVVIVDGFASAGGAELVVVIGAGDDPKATSLSSSGTELLVALGVLEIASLESGTLALDPDGVSVWLGAVDGNSLVADGVSLATSAGGAASLLTVSSILDKLGISLGELPCDTCSRAITVVEVPWLPGGIDVTLTDSVVVTGASVFAVV